MRREDVAQVGAVQDVLEGGKDFDPDGRPPFSGYESIDARLASFTAPWCSPENNPPARVEPDEICGYRHEWSKELSGNRKY